MYDGLLTFLFFAEVFCFGIAKNRIFSLLIFCIYYSKMDIVRKPPKRESKRPITEKIEKYSFIAESLESNELLRRNDLIKLKHIIEDKTYLELMPKIAKYVDSIVKSGNIPRKLPPGLDLLINMSIKNNILDVLKNADKRKLTTHEKRIYETLREYAKNEMIREKYTNIRYEDLVEFYNKNLMMHKMIDFYIENKKNPDIQSMIAFKFLMLYPEESRYDYCLKEYFRNLPKDFFSIKEDSIATILSMPKVSEDALKKFVEVLDEKFGFSRFSSLKKEVFVKNFVEQVDYKINSYMTFIHHNLEPLNKSGKMIDDISRGLEFVDILFDSFIEELEILNRRKD